MLGSAFENNQKVFLAASQTYRQVSRRFMPRVIFLDFCSYIENRKGGLEPPGNPVSGEVDGDQASRAIRPCSNAKAVRVAVLCRSSLAIMLERCFSTVLTLMHSRPAGFSLASSATAPNAATTGVSPAPCRTIENGLISRPGVHPTGRQNRTV